MYAALLCHPTGQILGIIALLVLSALLVLTFRWLIMRSDPLVFRLISDSEQLPQSVQSRWLSVSLTLACFFSGLLLLTRTTDVFTAALLVPFKLRGFFQSFVWTEDWSELFHFSAAKVIRIAVTGLKAAAALYLLMGAPHFVRWQLRRIDRFLVYPLPSQGARDE
jgi:hypothetical protein